MRRDASSLGWAPPQPGVTARGTRGPLTALLGLHISFPGPVREAQAPAVPPLSGPEVQAPLEVRSPGDPVSLLLPCGDPPAPGKRNPLVP